MASPGGIEVSRVSVRVVPDTSRLFEDLRADLAEIEARTELNIRTSVDSARLVEQTRLAVDEAQAAAGEIDIKTNVDKSQAAEASKAFSGLAGSISAVTAAVVLLGPALIPIVGVLGGIIAALAAPISLAGAGVTLFGFLTGAAIKQTETQAKKIAQLKKAVDSAQQSLNNTRASAAQSAANSLKTAQASAAASIKSAETAAKNATTAAAQASAAQRIQAAHAALSARQSSIAASQSASVSAAQRRYNEALVAYRAALHDLTPAQEKFLEAQTGLKNAFRDLIVKVGPALLGPPTQALQLMASLLPSIQPILKSFARVFSGFLSAIGDATKTQGFRDLIHTIANDGARSFTLLARIIANLTLAFGHFAADFLPFGESVLGSFAGATAALERFSTTANASDGIKAFVAYIQAQGPLVAKTISDLAGAVGHLIAALAPLGPPVLSAVDHLARGLSAIPTHDLTGAAIALVSLVASLKLLAPLAGVVEAAIAAPELALVAAAVVALAGGFILLYNHSKPFRDLIHELGDYFRSTWLPLIKSATHDVMPALKSAFNDISKAIADNQGFLEVVGKAIIALGSATVIAGLKLLVLQIRVLGKAIALVITVVHKLADLWLTELRFMLKGLALFVRVAATELGVFVDAAATAFGWIPKIGPKIKAAQAAFHSFTDNVVSGINGAANDLQDFQNQIDAIAKPPHVIRFTVDDIAAIKKLEALRHEIDRAVGPGGGIGHPASNGATAAPSFSGSSRTSSSATTSRAGPGINIQHATFTDAKDLSRQGTKWLRGRGGGGVNLTPSPAMGGSL